MKIYKEAIRVERYFDSKINKEEKIIDLLHVAEDYLNLSTLQRERLSEFEELDLKTADESKTDDYFLLYFGDIHFFFSCSHKFILLAERLLVRLKLEKTPYFCELKTYHGSVRNHFEHIDDRIDKRLRYRSMFSEVIEDKMEIKNTIYDVSDEALLPLYFIYDYIIKNLDDRYGNPTA